MKQNPLVTNIQRSDKILQWLSDKPLINRNLLCQMANLDVSTLHHLEKKTGRYKSISKKYLSEIEQILQPYGYQP